MAAITVTAADVRPPNLTQTIIRRFTAGGTVNVGDVVYVAADGDVEQADADAQASAQAIGIAVSVNGTTQTAAAAGDEVDVCVFGPLNWGASMTPGSVVYVSVTAGKGDHTAVAGASGDFSFVVGRALTATTIFVNPQVTVPSAA